MCISSLLMSTTTDWRNTQEPQKFPSKWKLVRAEICFAGIAVLALIESIAYAVLLTLSGIVSIVDIRPHLWIKVFFNSSLIALKWSTIDLVLNFTEPSICYRSYLGLITSDL